VSGVRVEAIRKSFGDLVALDRVSFDVADGAFFVLVGPSGAGKTTTLRVIAGLETPDAGEVYFGATPARGATPAARDVAMVFQSYALYPKKSAFENIASPLRARRRPESEV
jgi:multiple sugar transport system ATP-binding protein